MQCDKVVEVCTIFFLHNEVTATTFGQTSPVISKSWDVRQHLHTRARPSCCRGSSREMELIECSWTLLNMDMCSYRDLQRHHRVRQYEVLYSTMSRSNYT